MLQDHTDRLTLLPLADARQQHPVAEQPKPRARRTLVPLDRLSQGLPVVPANLERYVILEHISEGSTDTGRPGV